ncbi:nuclear transport factor 2 family protein [Gillisia hiemivivida]|uniref:Nuclear transport factor 2 family protein n=1 Tax=Gillisia hiemivivida TaxID=291190 RepID=A0A5C6ZY36_9FLAO|nr:nuclear transport factor 2 family protein [Gillisia hiemivivida]TXD95835.1 nuclear transport factor 2 family protein [Gillisia hiemivivida]
MKKLILLLLISTFACNNTNSQKDETSSEKLDNEKMASEVNSKEKINTALENWHKAAANANFDEYFGLMTKDGVFIGTDATENWQNKEFREFSKPYFDKGKAWSFTTLERNIYTEKDNSLAWFDELLSTQMGICRGSGVMEKVDGAWKVKHYVLSIAIPNDDVSEVTEMKKQTDSLLISKLKMGIQVN